MASSALFDISLLLQDKISKAFKTVADALGSIDPQALVAAIGVGLATISASIVTYNLFFHPLRRFPGPLLHRATRLGIFFTSMRGQLPKKVLGWHEQYGPVIRIAPDELAFATPQAWRDIYGHRRDLPTKEIPKSWRSYRQWKDAPQSILSADYDFHAVLRRSIAPGFSEKAMRDQEPLIGKYVDRLVERLKQTCNGRKDAQNMRDWYNWTTFDIIGDLTYGESFGCLETSKNHAWMRMFSESLQVSLFIMNLRCLGLTSLGLVILYFMALRGDMRTFIQGKMALDVRIKGEPRPDLMDSLIRRMDEENLTSKKLLPTAIVLTLAGSETTATLLAGVTYLLLDNPDCLAKVTGEVRSSFTSEDEITLISVQKLSYMLACLTEALRFYPPVPVGMPRMTPKGGATIDGVFVPEHTTISIYQYAAGRLSKYWTEPANYLPERIGKEGMFSGDQLDMLNPFSIGPRNCVGMNLAYAEMRLILARILYSFDMKLADESRNWLQNQKVYSLWDKPDLWVHLSPRNNAT